MSASAFRPAEKILVRGVNWLGDAVMTTPALQRLREARPNAHITLLTAGKLADLWLHHPDIDAVLAFTREESIFQIARRLRKERFDTALLFPNSPRSALEVFLARIPQRIGYARPWRNFFLTQRVAPHPEATLMRKRSVGEIKSLIDRAGQTSPAKFPAAAHHIYHYLRLVSALGAKSAPVPPRLIVTAAEVEKLRQKFQLPAEPGETRPWFGLNPGAEYGPAKRWPAERYIATAIELQRRTHCRWLIFGGKADVELAARIAEAIRRSDPNEASSLPSVVDLAGQTSLRELCAAMKICSVVVTNDTGPMHVAAAVGTPVVALFGSTSPELTAPGLPGDPHHALLKSDAPCAPCFLRECPIDFRCMQGLPADAVIAAVLKLISQCSR